MNPPARELASRPNFYGNRLMDMLKKIEIENEICRQELGISVGATAADFPPANRTNSSDHVNYSNLLTGI